MDGTVIIVAIVAAIPAIYTAWVGLQNGRKLDAGAEQLTAADERNWQATQAVKKEVTPNNGKSNGETADAVLSLLILAISPELRTPEQTEHLRAMAIEDPKAAVETLAAELLAMKGRSKVEPTKTSQTTTTRAPRRKRRVSKTAPKKR